MNNKYLRYGIPAGCVAIIAGVLAGIFGTGGGPAPEKAKVEAEQGAEPAKLAATEGAGSAASGTEAKPQDSTATEAAKATSEAASGAASEAAPSATADAASGAASDAAASAATEAASGAVAAATEKANDVVAPAADKASDAATAATEEAAGSAAGTSEAVAEAAMATADAVTDSANMAAESGSDSASAAAGAAEGAVGDAESAAADATAAVTEASETGASATEQATPAAGSVESGSAEAGAENKASSTETTTEEAPPSAEPGAAASEDKPATVASAEAESAPSATAEQASAGGEAASAPGAEASPIKPSFDVVRVDPNGGTVMAGRATPGSEVAIMDDSREIGRTRANENGEWVFTTDQPMPSGDRQLSLKEIGPGGLESDQVVVLSVPEPKESQKPGAMAVMQSRDGGQTVVLQLPEESKPAAAGGEAFATIDSVDYASNGEITVSGRAAPGAKLNAYIDNVFVAGVQADADGRWRFTPGPALALGDHTLRVDSVDDAGKVLARAETPLTREPLEKLVPPGETLVIVQPGNSLWRIARRTLGGGIHYSEIFQANRDQIRDPDMIYPGQIFTVPLG